MKVEIVVEEDTSLEEQRRKVVREVVLRVERRGNLLVRYPLLGLAQRR